MRIDTLELGELRANCHIIDCGNGLCAAADIGGDPEAADLAVMADWNSMT